MRIIHIFWIVLVLLSGCKKPAEVLRPVSATLRGVPATQSVCEPFSIYAECINGNTAGQTLTLTIMDALGVYTIHSKIKDQKAAFHNIPLLSTGLIRFYLYDDTHLVDSDSVILIPEKAVNLESFLGPKSILANGSDFSMLTVFPTDMFGNPCKDSTELDLIVRPQKKEAFHQAVYTKHGFANEQFPSGTQKESILIKPVLEGKDFTEKVFYQNAGLPEAFHLFSPNDTYGCGSNQFFTVNTDILHDRFGNVITDGTMVYFEIRNDQKQISTVQTVVVNGEVSVRLRCPEQPGRLQITGMVSGMCKSQTLTLRFVKT